VRELGECLLSSIEHIQIAESGMSANLRLESVCVSFPVEVAASQDTAVPPPHSPGDLAARVNPPVDAHVIVPRS
jgi:hypothetical protein